ncbi:hypothetical protein [Amycolatopsis sp. CA-126428]|uniref:hypothetical protein n=1 Tax=Amycolatopsis sp. CA-126428 TaxID=2073158 RepID=UPI0011B02367|nr:hypothetical protein [Amycolatopsis sp. CA-126428]
MLTDSKWVSLVAAQAMSSLAYRRGGDVRARAEGEAQGLHYEAVTSLIMNYGDAGFCHRRRGARAT